MRRRVLLSSFAGGIVAGSAAYAQSPVAPKELGAVRFARDLDATLATRPAKPLFLLFQEIPG